MQLQISLTTTLCWRFVRVWLGRGIGQLTSVRSFSSPMTTILGQRERQEEDRFSRATSLRETLQNLQRQHHTADSDGMNTTASAGIRDPLRKTSLRRHCSRDEQSVSRKHTMQNQPLEPTGWRLSTSSVQLGSPLSLGSVDQPWNVSPTSPRAESGFLQQLKNFTRPHLEGDSMETRPHGRDSASRSRRTSNQNMLSDYAAGRDLPAPVDANDNAALSPPRHQPVYMPESPVTIGDKRIQQRKESQIQQTEKKRVILGHAFGKSNSRQTPPRAAQRRKALLLNETEEERRKREKESVEAWRVRRFLSYVWTQLTFIAMLRPGRQLVLPRTTSPHDVLFRAPTYPKTLRRAKSKIRPVDTHHRGVQVRVHPNSWPCK